MKLPTLFTKIPRYKRFAYEPRFYNALQEQQKEREGRIRAELKSEDKLDPDAQLVPSAEELAAYRSSIAGSFKNARRTASRQSDPSTNILRLLITTFLVVGLIAYLQFGNVALYGLVVLIPFYFFIRLRGIKRK